MREALKMRSLLTGKEMASSLSEIAPGVFDSASIDPADVTRYGLAWLMRDTDGRYTPVLKGHSQHVKLSRQLTEQLGFRELSYNGLRRLVHAGFIIGTRITPDVIHIDLASLLAHIEAARDPDFWNRARRKRFSDACAEVKSLPD